MKIIKVYNTNEDGDMEEYRRDTEAYKYEAAYGQIRENLRKIRKFPEMMLKKAGIFEINEQAMELVESFIDAVYDEVEFPDE
jgi:hypothetical protein